MAFGLLKKVSVALAVAACAAGVGAPSAWAQGGRLPSDALAQIVRPVGIAGVALIGSEKRVASLPEPAESHAGGFGDAKVTEIAVQDKTLVR